MHEVGVAGVASEQFVKAARKERIEGSQRVAVRIVGEPSTAPRDKDRVAAQRSSTAAGASDERVVVPREGFVAGNAIVDPRDRETKVAAPVPGRIAVIAVREGDKVSRGTLLVQLENAPEQAALPAAEGDVASAQQDYEKATHGQRREDIDASLRDADAAQARAEMSADGFRRLEQAAKGGAATPDEVEKAQRQAERDRRSFEAAQARSRAMVAGSRFEDIAAARARLQAAQAQRDQARANLERLAVRAPIDGQILQVKYRVGEYVTPGGGDPLVVPGDTSMLPVRGPRDSRDWRGAPVFRNGLT